MFSVLGLLNWVLFEHVLMWTDLVLPLNQIWVCQKDWICPVFLAWVIYHLCIICIFIYLLPIYIQRPVWEKRIYSHWAWFFGLIFSSEIHLRIFVLILGLFKCFFNNFLRLNDDVRPTSFTSCCSRSNDVRPTNGSSTAIVSSTITKHCPIRPIQVQSYRVGVKVRNMKMYFNTGGTWLWVGQSTLMMKIYDIFYSAESLSSNK